MIRDNDVNWQFWRKCYCALDRDLCYLIEMEPKAVNGQFCLKMTLNQVSADYSRITKEFIAMKCYPLDSTKIDIPKEWEKFTKVFYEDYFQAKDSGCANYKGMMIRK